MDNTYVWSVLGIAPTEDEKEIKNAYRTKLVSVNPEDDAEGFMKLRRAYEDAIKLSKQGLANEETPKEEFTGISARIDSIYSDFFSRIDEDKWAELFDSDEFVSLVSSEESFEKLIEYLQTHFLLPQKVWKLINETFDISNRKSELSELYPEEFIEYIINNAKYKDIINYYLMSGNEKLFDEFIEKFYKLDIGIRNNVEGIRQLYNDLDTMGVFHPYLVLEDMKITIAELEINEYSKQEDLSEEQFSALCRIQEDVESVCDDYPDDMVLLLSCGNVAMMLGDLERAREYYDEAKNLDPDEYNLKTRYADLTYYEGEYKEARNLYMDLLKVNHYDSKVRVGMIRANQKIIDVLNTRIEALENGEELYFDEDDDLRTVDDMRLELGWCFYQSYRFDEALYNLDQFLPSEEKKFEYFNVKGRVYLCLNRYDEAVTCFKIWKDAIEALDPEDTSEKTEEKRKRFEYVNFLIADCYIRLKKYDEATSYLEISMQKPHDEMVLSYEANCELKYGMKEYEQCILACEALLDFDDRNYIGYYFMAKAYFKLDYIKETLHYCERAISVFPYTIEPYILEIMLYMKYKQLDGAMQVVERYRVYELESDMLSYYEALILFENEKYKDGIKILERICENYNAENSDLIEDVKIEDVYVKLGEYYDQNDEFEMAEKYYLEALSINPEHESANGRLGIVYRQMERFGEALEKLSMQLMIKPSLVYYINRGIVNRLFDNFKSAVSDFRKAIEIDPSNAYCHSRLGMIYELHRDFKDAIESYDKALQYADESEEEFTKDIMLLKARVYQCLKDFEEGEKVYRSYIEKFGENINVVMECAKLLYRNDRPKDAINLLTRYMESTDVTKEKQDCLVYLCQIYGEEGMLARANECYMLGKANMPEDDEIVAQMAEIFAQQGIYDKAKELYIEAIELDKEDKENYYIELVEILMKKKSFKNKSINNYAEKASELIKDGNARQKLKKIKLSRILKEYDEAVGVIGEIISSKRCAGCHYSACHRAYYEHGLIYEAKKKYQDALGCYEKALMLVGHNVLYENKIKELRDK